MNEKWKSRIIGILAVLVIVGLTVLAYSMRHRIMLLQRFGYPGVFMIELIANASVMIPIPGSSATIAMAPLLNPVILAVVASTAATIGEMFAYLAGIGGSTLVENARWYERVRLWIEKYGKIVITLLAAIPNPLFDTAGIVAGGMKVPPWQFFLLCWIGKTINRLIIVFGSSTLIRFFLPPLF